MTRRMLKHRKAISPILATLLLVVIAVAAIVVTYAWIMTYMSSAAHQAGVRLYKSNVRFYNQSGLKIDIDVGNSGDSDTRIIQVYAGNSPSTLENRTIAPLTLAAGGLQTITISYPWDYGKTYHFKVVSSSGQVIEFPEQAPATP